MQKFDAQKVQHKLEVFNQAYSELNLLLQSAYNELVNNYQWASVKWNLYVSIQCLLDACSHISVAYGERPSTYREIVKAVLKHNLIEKDLGLSFEELASLRNVLAHWYNSLDEEFIYNNLKENHKDLNDIASAIQKFLDDLDK